MLLVRTLMTIVRATPLPHKGPSWRFASTSGRLAAVSLTARPMTRRRSPGGRSDQQAHRSGSGQSTAGSLPHRLLASHRIAHVERP